jgi:hypothetical protein
MLWGIPFTLWYSNMAMENPPLENMLIGDFPASYL